MYSETFLSLLTAAAVLLGALISAPVWLDLAQRHSGRRLLGGTSFALGILLSIWTLSALPVRAQQPDLGPGTEREVPEQAGSLIADPPAAPGPSAPPDAEVPFLEVPLESSDIGPGSTNDLGTIVNSKDRPDWVDAPPILDGDVHRITVHSEFQAREDDARHALDQELVKATRAYVEDRLGSSKAPIFFSFSPEEIRSRFTKPDVLYHEVHQFSFGPMHQYHTVLEFPQEFREQIHKHWEQVRAAGNLVKIGGGTLGVMLLLVIVFGYFRLDTATRGYYTSRLQFLVALAILALIVAGFVFARSTTVWVQWLLL